MVVDPDPALRVPVALGDDAIELRGGQDPSLSEGAEKVFSATIPIPIPPN